MKNHRNHRQLTLRRGSTYLVVVAVAIVASVISIGALGIQSSLRRKAQLDHDFSNAGALAQSAVEFGLHKLNQDELWRENYKSLQEGSYSIPVRLDAGKLAWSLEDPVDYEIDDDDADIVKIFGFAELGNSKRVFSLMAVPAGRPLDVLRTAVHASGNINVAHELNVGMGPVSSGNALNVGSGQLIGNAESYTVDDEKRVSGGVLLAELPKKMPSSLLFRMYSTMASEMDIATLPVQYSLKNTILSPSTNPAGNKNPNGIYKVSVPAGVSFTIENTKIDGTLLVELKGESSKLHVGEGVVWSPHCAKFPTLIAYTKHDNSNDVLIECKGNYTTTVFTTALVEGTAQAAEPESTTSEQTVPTFLTRSASITGLIHVIRDNDSKSSSTEVVATNRFKGCIVVDGDLTLMEYSHLVAMPSLLSHPPLGYTQARDQSEMLSNSSMDNGFEMWQPTFENEFAAGVKLDWQLSNGENCIRVAERKTAATGIQQDVTSWLESGHTYVLALTVRTAKKDEGLKMVLEYVADSGLQRETVTQSATTSDSTITATFAPTFSGKLESARLLISTTTYSQDFCVSQANIADTRLIKPGELAVFPTTWQRETAP